MQAAFPTPPAVILLSSIAPLRCRIRVPHDLRRPACATTNPDTIAAATDAGAARTTTIRRCITGSLHAFVRRLRRRPLRPPPLYLAINLLTSVALFGLTRRLFFGPPLAWWTVFACLNALPLLSCCCPKATSCPPDQPLLLFLALGALGDRGKSFTARRGVNALWALAGVSLGLAGLSKYSAAFAPLGLFGFFVSSPAHRRWLVDPRPYLGAALGVACFTPAIVWNAEHGWVSFAFQAARAADRLSLDGHAWKRLGDGVVAQIGLVTPWIFWPVAMGLGRAIRSPAGTPEKFLLWLAAPPLVAFAVLPLLGQKQIAHWFDSGWLFTFPLAGLWLANRSPLFQLRYAIACVALAIVSVIVYLVAINFASGLFPNAPDPERHNREWPATALQSAYKRSGAEYLLVDDWRTGRPGRLRARTRRARLHDGVLEPARLRLHLRQQRPSRPERAYSSARDQWDRRGGARLFPRP